MEVSGRQCIVGLCLGSTLWLFSSCFVLGVLPSMGRRLAFRRDEAKRLRQGLLSHQSAWVLVRAALALHHFLSWSSGSILPSQSLIT